MRIERATFPSVQLAASVGADATCRISSIDKDRDGDIIEPRGIDFTAYMKNPVVLYAHDYHSLPVGKCVGIRVTDTDVTASWKWLPNDEFAARVRNAWDAGFLNGTSVGFKPTKAERLGAGLPEGVRFVKCELLEFSIVPVPANQTAVRALKAFGLLSRDFEMQRDTRVPLLKANPFGKTWWSAR